MKPNPQYVTIVSGLPRSGTSLCMKMLEAGGLNVLADGVRGADEDNPNGYYEYEAVKKTRHDSAWIQDAHGKAVKMVYRLLYDLPVDYDYRVIFMRRDLQEVVISQEIMLQRQRRESGDGGSAAWADLFRTETEKLSEWLDQQQNFRLLEVDYNELMRNPAPTLSLIRSFLDDRVDTDAMLRVIDPSLYRNRNDQKTPALVP